MAISIHAPAEGATEIVCGCFRGGIISIHAPAEGATSRRLFRCLASEEFQSTLPRRERHCCSGTCEAVTEYFNPRSRGGSDLTWTQRIYNILTISIHAPAEGATERRERGRINRRFQFTLPRRERLLMSMLCINS